ncbi:hypothetical protein [Kineococcus sp. SYSU DK005]|uniref:hypothetical protein n=1 Tax=Kineococcus sp. SYSU DK005 TaxID=3383126 RepID=UPI003D7C4C61
MEIDLRGGGTAAASSVVGGVGSAGGARGGGAFAGGLLTLMVVPERVTLRECLAVLRQGGFRVWREHLPAPVDEEVAVAGVACDEAPSMDAIGEVSRRVLAVLEAAGVEVEVRGSGYVSADALRRWGAHAPG